MKRYTQHGFVDINDAGRREFWEDGKPDWLVYVILIDIVFYTLACAGIWWLAGKIAGGG